MATRREREKQRKCWEHQSNPSQKYIWILRNLVYRTTQVDHEDLLHGSVLASAADLLGCMCMRLRTCVHVLGATQVQIHFQLLGFSPSSNTGEGCRNGCCLGDLLLKVSLSATTTYCLEKRAPCSAIRSCILSSVCGPNDSLKPRNKDGQFKRATVGFFVS